MEAIATGRGPKSGMRIASDTVAVMGRVACPFSTLGLIYGIQTLLINVIEDPELVRDNMAYFTDYEIAYGKAQLDAGADGLWLGDCVSLWSDGFESGTTLPWSATP